MKFYLPVLLLLIVCVSANHELNNKYRNVLEGSQRLTQAIGREIYKQFQSPINEKSYFRFKIFYENLKGIKKHNSEGHSWTQGINDFADMTFSEFEQLSLMQPQNCSTTAVISSKQSVKPQDIPEKHDWSALGKVSPVKKQGLCGACWAFSAIGAMQAHWNILNKGKNVTFSEQQLIDCSTNFENHGCFGGLPSHAFEYIRYNQGLETDNYYPYTGKKGGCMYDADKKVGYCKGGSYNVTRGNEFELAEKLFNVGPISVAFKVTLGFLFYKDGIYSSRGCGYQAEDVNHAVLAVGYGIEDGVKFWYVKNSWGTKWGDNGYFKIVRNVNMCGIAQCNSYPLVEDKKDILAE